MIKYPHIENISTISSTQLVQLNNKTYCVTEKIHGANCQFVHTKKYADAWGIFSRNNQITNESFYNAVEVLKAEIMNPAWAVEDYLSKSGYPSDKYYYFGEIFGGCYDHPEVPKAVGAKRVQRGVYYSPKNHWKCFDIGIEKDGEFHFIPQKILFAAYKETNFPVVPLLGVYSTLEDALKHPNNGLSIVHKDYGLPPIDNNIMEGVVIKLWGEDTPFNDERVVFKNKNEIFSEKAHSQKQRDIKVLSENFSAVCQIADTYLTSNRIINAMSHIGECTFKDIGSILKEVITDIHDEMSKDCPEFIALEKKEQSTVCKLLSTKAAKMIKEEILKQSTGA